jgi:DNA-binding Lrp family transcriptional regulator
MVSKNMRSVRLKQILTWLEEEGALSIKEFQSRLSVSHMTVHRDLDTLSKRGLINKVRGGAILAQDPREAGFAGSDCTMCGSRISRRLEFYISCKGKEQIAACCPHCGLMLLSDYPEAAAVLARDFLYGHMVNIYQAYFVIGSEVRLCCEPTVLCFARKSDAIKFSNGFSGQVMVYSEAKSYLSSSHHVEDQ